MCALHGLRLTKRKFYSLAGMPIRDIYLLLAKEQGARGRLRLGCRRARMDQSSRCCHEHSVRRGLTRPHTRWGTAHSAGVTVDIEEVLADKRRIHEKVRRRFSCRAAPRPQTYSSATPPRLTRGSPPPAPQMPMPESIKAVEDVIRSYHGRLPLAVASSGVRPNVTRVRSTATLAPAAILPGGHPIVRRHRVRRAWDHSWAACPPRPTSPLDKRITLRTVRPPRQHLEHCGLLQFFDTVVTCEDVTHGKPAPDLFLEAARRLGVAPERRARACSQTRRVPLRACAGELALTSPLCRRCKVYEDADLGIQAAHAAGMEARAIHSAPQRLSAAGPSGCATRLAGHVLNCGVLSAQVVDVRHLQGYPYPTEEEMAQEEQALMGAPAPAAAARAAGESVMAA